jgi:hypothetical protein
MNTKMILAAAIVAVSGTAASAQVVTEINTLMNTLTTNVGGTFADIALNFNAINGSVDISENGQNAGDNSTDNSITDLYVISEVDADLDLSGLPGGSVDLGLDIGSLSDNDSILNVVTATTEATTMNFDDIATTAVGAVNSGTMSLTEGAASIISGSATNASSTAASADFASLVGSGVAGLQGAANFADITASITVSGNGGSMDFETLSTVAAGAIDSSSITAIFVGTDTVGAP